MLETSDGLGTRRKESLIIVLRTNPGPGVCGWAGGFLQQRRKLIRGISVYTVLAVMSAIHNLRSDALRPDSTHLRWDNTSTLTTKVIPASMVMIMTIIITIFFAFICPVVLLVLLRVVLSHLSTTQRIFFLSSIFS